MNCIIISAKMLVISLIYVILISLIDNIHAADQVQCSCFLLLDCSINIVSTDSSHKVSCNGNTKTLTCDTALVGKVGGLFSSTVTHPLGLTKSYNALSATTWTCAPPPEEGIGCSKCADYPNKRIVGGSEVTPGQLPYQVSIMIDLRPFGITNPGAQNSAFSHGCGGSIINKRYILSAAHCLIAYQEILGIFPGAPLVVSVGDHDVCDDTSGQKVGVEGFGITPCNYIAPKYGVSPHDLWLIKLSEDLVWSETIQPVCLPQISQDNFEDRDALVSGWGTTVAWEASGNIPPFEPQQCILKSGQQKILKNSDPICENYVVGCPEEKALTNLCGRTATDAPCQGDDGGPLVVENNGKALQVGVMSYAAGCLSSGGEPAVYGRVSHYLDWIKENTADGEC